MRLTGNIFLDVLLTVLYAFLVMILFNLANIYYLRKQSINLWYALAGSIVFFAAALGVLFYYPNGLWHLVPLTISLFAFLWFIDLRRRGKRRKADKQIVMKPKAKPNRARQVTGGAAAPAQPAAKPKKKK